MSYASQQQGLTGPKLVAMIIALSIVGLVGAGLVIFLAVDAVTQAIERVTTVEVKEEEPPPPPPDEPPPPPEEPRNTAPPPPNAPPALIDIPRDSQIETTQRETPREVIREPSRDVVADPGPPTPPTPPKKSQARRVQPKGQKQWAARIQENYPRRAQQEEIEGTVGVRVTVTADGKATACQVTASSGSKILDEAACKDLERYGRFDPALDDDGNPISASWPTRITYTMN